MNDLFGNPGFAIFAGSLLVTFLLCLVEGLSLGVAGTTTPSFMDFETQGDGSILHYLNAGHLPLTLLVASAASVFGLTGLGLQQAAVSLNGQALSLVVAVPIAGLASIPATHFISKSLGRLIPNTETTAISSKTLIGRQGRVLAGTGKRGLPVQVKLRDEHGQAHYVMVEPLYDDNIFNQGDAVLITDQAGAIYLAIHKENNPLQETDDGRH